MLTFIKTSELRNIEVIQLKNRYYTPKKETITGSFFNFRNKSRKSKNTNSRKRSKSPKSRRKVCKSRKSRK